MKKLFTLIATVLFSLSLFAADSDFTVKIGFPSTGSLVEKDTPVDVVVKVTPTDITTGTLEYCGKSKSITFTDGKYRETFTDYDMGKCVFKVTVTYQDVTKSVEASFFCTNAPEERPLPEGMKEGINYNKETKEVTLVFRAPLNRDVFILGDFNNWEFNEDYHCYRDSVWCQVGKTVGTNKYPDYKDSTYHRIFWRTFTIEEPKRKYAYAFRVDNKQFSGDPYATVVLDASNDGGVKNAYKEGLPSYPSAVSGILVPVLELEEENPYEWQVTDFKIADKKKLVIYELLLRDFSPSKDIPGFLDKIDYISDLGVNAVELMPVCEFDGNSSWGYNPNHYFAYDKFYGSKTLYKQLVDECHKRGIAVIVDMVFNHATGNNPMAKLYWDGSSTAEQNPWFNRVSRHPYTEGGIDINHEYDGTRQYFRRVLQYWLTEFKVDGFRMDLAKGFTQRNTGTNVGQWGQYDKTRVVITDDYYDAVKEANPDAVFILEHLGEYQEQKKFSDEGMFPWRNMNNSYCQAAMGYASDSKFVDSDGKGSGTGRGAMFDSGFISYGESHDEERNFYKAKEYGMASMKGKPSVYLKRVPLNIAFVSLIPGPKMIWQFGELGYDYSINTCSDGKTIKNECRVAEKPIPFKLGWQNDPDRMDAYAKSAKVINLRTKYPEFFDVTNVTTSKCAVTNWLSPRRLDIRYEDPETEAKSAHVIVLGNFDADNYVTTNGGFSRTGVWYDYMTGEQFDVKRVDKTITLAPGELRILTSRDLSKPVVFADENQADGEVTVSPTIVEDVISVWSSAPVENIEVVNLAGETVLAACNVDQISMAGLIKGIYIVRVKVAGVISTHKVIKK